MKVNSNMLIMAGLGFIGLSVIPNFIYLVNPGERALIMDSLSGLKQTVYEPGYHLKIPFIQVSPSCSESHHL